MNEAEKFNREHEGKDWDHLQFPSSCHTIKAYPGDVTYQRVEFSDGSSIVRTRFKEWGVGFNWQECQRYPWTSYDGFKYCNQFLTIGLARALSNTKPLDRDLLVELGSPSFKRYKLKGGK